jgi:hypothetical protein
VIDNVDEEVLRKEVREELKMRSVETRNARTSFRGLVDGGGTVSWWRCSNAVRLNQESIANGALHRELSKGCRCPWPMAWPGFQGLRFRGCLTVFMFMILSK